MNVNVNSVKKGDTIPVYGRISIIVAGVDVSSERDYTGWEISCDLVGPDGVKAYDVPVVFISGTPVFSGEISSAICDTLEVGKIYRMDLRFKDTNGAVRSTGTQQIKIAAPVSETP